MTSTRNGADFVIDATRCHTIYLISTAARVVGREQQNASTHQRETHKKQVVTVIFTAASGKKLRPALVSARGSSNRVPFQILHLGGQSHRCEL